MLIVLALVKLFITTLCLTTGWKGGYIFPAMFAGAALRMAAHLIFPVILEAVAVAATMAGTMVPAMKVPIFSGLFVMALVQTETAPVVNADEADAVIILPGDQLRQFAPHQIMRCVDYRPARLHMLIGNAVDSLAHSGYGPCPSDRIGRGA